MKKVTLGDVCNKAGSNIAQKDLQENEGKYPIYGASGLIKKVDFYQQELPYIAVVKDGAGIGRTMLLPGHSSVIGTVQYILPIDRETVDLKYLYYAIVHMNLSKYFSGATIPHIYYKDYKKEPLRLPELEKQREIAIVFQRIDELIAKREQQLKGLDELVKSRFIELFGDIDRKINIGSLCDVTGGYSFKGKDIISEGNVKLLQIGNVYLDNISWKNVNYLPKGYDKKYPKFLLSEGDILIALTRPIIQSLGNVKACIVKQSDLPCMLNQRVGRIVAKSDEIVDLKYIYGCLMTDKFTKYVEECSIGCSQPNISTKDIENYRIPDVSYDKQVEYVRFKTQTDKSKHFYEMEVAA